MTAEKRKSRETDRLHLPMDFDEAMRRVARVKPAPEKWAKAGR